MIKPILVLSTFFAVSFYANANADEVVAPSEIFALEHIENNLNPESAPQVDASLGEILPERREIRAEMPFSATLAFANRNTNKREVVEVSSEDGSSASAETSAFSVRVLACTKNVDGVYGNDVAFLEVSQKTGENVFSGWVYKARPSVNAFEHPVYSMFLMSCDK